MHLPRPFLEGKHRWSFVPGWSPVSREDLFLKMDFKMWLVRKAWPTSHRNNTWTRYKERTHYTYQVKTHPPSQMCFSLVDTPPTRAWNNKNFTEITNTCHFTVVCLVTWPMNANEARGELILIVTSFLFSINCTPINIRTCHLQLCWTLGQNRSDKTVLYKSALKSTSFC